MSASAIANWFTEHYRARQRVAGTQAAARQLRKQGVPIEVALAILAGRTA